MEMMTRLYSLTIAVPLLLLYSLWTSYQFIRSNNNTTEKKLALLKEKDRKHNLLPLIDAEKINQTFIDSIIMDNMQDDEINDNNQVWPSWKNGTIEIQPMLDFIHRLLLYPNETYTETRKIETVQLTMFAETPYIVTRSGIFASNTLRRRNVGGQFRHRVVPVEGLMNEALQLFLSSQERQTKWPQLDKLLIRQKRHFPFLVFFGDHLSCDYHNYQDENNVSRSLPLFTFGIRSNQLNCWNGFPMASYKMIRDSKRAPTDWDVEFQQRDLHFPWHEKIPRAVWRGSLSDSNVIVDGETPRSKLVDMANSVFNDTPLFDVGFSNRNHFEVLENSSRVHPIKDSIRPFPELQRFVAVIDIDGNAWSSRFPTQLCLNSVSLKVEPRYMDYFMGTQVKPGVHYVSVKADLSDLLDKVLWIMLYPQESMQIAENARNWCREHMIWKSLSHDLLDSWEKYLTWMNEHDWYRTWEKQWNVWKKNDSVFQRSRVRVKLSNETLAGSFPSS